MTVSAQTPINRSTANGVTTVFPYTFKILAEGDIEVSVDGVVKTLTTDYTVSGVGVDGGGNVTMLVAPANATTVVRRRQMAYIREVDYQDQGELPTDTLDDDQDAPILMIQQLAEEVERGLRLPITASGASAELPTPAALEVIRWNASATALESFLIASVGSLVVTPFMRDTFLLTATAAAARSALGASSVGDELFIAANATAARSAISAAGSGAATASGLTMATSRLLGRTTASSGALEEISVGTGLTLSSGTLAATATGITLGTPVAATSGTSIDFTGIPATAKRITINFAEVSLSGTAALFVQLGDSGGVETSGYSSVVTNGAAGTSFSSTGFLVINDPGTAASLYSGSVVLSLENTSANRWVQAGTVTRSAGPFVNSSAGSKATSAVLDRIRITTTNGTDTFDAGEVNISYE